MTTPEATLRDQIAEAMIADLERDRPDVAPDEEEKKAAYDLADVAMVPVRAALADLAGVAAYVSRGRRFVDVEPYPDALARKALAVFDG